jgi:signal peptidase II
MYSKIRTKSPYVILILFVAFLDQVTKSYFIDLFSGVFLKGISICPYLNFVHAWNQGISFGLFQGADYSNIIFMVLSSIITIILFVMLYKNNSTTYSISYSLIIGGAIGNIVDRVKYGAVFDFIDFHVASYHWPAFNIADSFVCIGALLLVFFSLRVKN